MNDASAACRPVPRIAGEVMIRIIVALLIIVCRPLPASAGAEGFAVPYPSISAPVVHSGGYDILSCGGTSVVLDRAHGLTIAMIGNGDAAENGLRTSDAVLENASLKAWLAGAEGDTVLVDQSFDPAPRLLIIDQGPGRVAARARFTLYSADMTPRGSGTIDLYIYAGRIFILPSIYIDYSGELSSVVQAGFLLDVPGKAAELIADGSKLMPTGTARFLPFGGKDEGFHVTVNNPGRFAVRMGWLRNEYPAWMYLRDIHENPETDELYEKWPPWIVQRSGPPVWTVSESAGLDASFSKDGLERLSFLWTRGDSLDIPVGGYRALNGVLSVFTAPTSSEALQLWKAHETPLPPRMKGGEFRYYNEFEGVYEVDTAGKENVSMLFDNLHGDNFHEIFVRLWNLSGTGACEFTVNGRPEPIGLYNDGDIVEDPMVSVVKRASGPARFAGAAVSVGKGEGALVAMSRSRGVQFVCQMYSDLETFEAWSDVCAGAPLFRFHLRTGEIYRAVLPGKTEYAFFKLPLYWMRNGVNQDTFMNHTRGFELLANGPDRLKFSYTGVNLQGTGLSTYTVTVPYELDCLSFDVEAAFSPLDDGRRWTSLEYCDLYPFEHVYRRDFHYRNIVYLTGGGEFERIGTGAWSGGFETVPLPDSLGFYGRPEKREGPGTKTPDASDGSVWLVGGNAGRGTILFRRGEWTPTGSARPVFSICNAWVDIHNTIAGRTSLGSGETISYSITVFPGRLPDVRRLNDLYRKAAGGTTVKRVGKVNFSLEGEITGFEVE